MITQNVLNSTWVPTLYDGISFLIFLLLVALTIGIEVGLFTVFLKDSKNYKTIIMLCLIGNILSGIIGFLVGLP